MPANTPVYKWPYPVAGDPIADGAKAIENLARAAEKTLQSLPAGSGGSPGTPDATALATVRRDAHARAQMLGPVYPLDIANKQYVDAAVPDAINVAGSVATVADLPADVRAGTGYIVTDTGHLYIRTPRDWRDAGPFRGPAGPQGKQGEPGPQGKQGEPGRDGGVQQDTLDAAIATRVANAAGQTLTVWTGTQAEYDKLDAATKNAAGFIAVIRG